jgi:hypothetical protein
MWFHRCAMAAFERKSETDKTISIHGSLFAAKALVRRRHKARIAVGADIAWRLNSDHYQLDPAVFKAFPCQTVARHLLDSVPVLTEIARSLKLSGKLGLQTARLERISVRDLKKHRLLPFFQLGHSWQAVAH